MSIVTSDGYLNDAESFPAMVVASSSTIRNLIITCSDIPTGAETAKITVRKNWQDTVLAAILDNSTPAGIVGYIEVDDIHSFAVVKGDWITVRCQTSAGCNTVQNIMVTLQT